MVLTCTHNLCFEQKHENSKKNQPKIVIFTFVKNRCILHGSVFVMVWTGREHMKSMNKYLDCGANTLGERCSE